MYGTVTVLGLVSRPSLEGIDVALVATDGYRRFESGPSLTFPYEPPERPRLADTIAAIERNKAADQTLLAEIEQQLTRLSALAVMQFLERFALPRDRVMLLGFPGFSLARGARRLGDAALLARLTRIDVICDFFAVEGHGALMETMGGLLGEAWPGDKETVESAHHLEAEASAYLAVRALRRLPLSVSGAAGAGRPATAGRVVRAPRR